MPERSSESGQDYDAVESVEAVGSQVPLLGDRPNQPRNPTSFQVPRNRNRSFQMGWFDCHPWLRAVQWKYGCCVLLIKSTYGSKAIQTVAEQITGKVSFGIR